MQTRIMFGLTCFVVLLIGTNAISLLALKRANKEIVSLRNEYAQFAVGYARGQTWCDTPAGRQFVRDLETSSIMAVGSAIDNLMKVEGLSVEEAGGVIQKELLESAEILKTNILLGNFNTRYFYEDIADIKDFLWNNKNADVVFTHSPNSSHTDHTVLFDCVKSIFQEQTILCFEDLKGGSCFNPTCWEILNPSDIDKKIKALECYNTQRKRAYFKNVRNLAIMRGSQINEEFAEAFEVIRIVK